MSFHWNTESSQYHKSENTVAKGDQISEMEIGHCGQNIINVCTLEMVRYFN